ncbi:MAG: ROK family transcriptional regulator [Bacteroidales bacterium]|nr:ROK family transcriptional regulator [Bacteroidales bacterium]
MEAFLDSLLKSRYAAEKKTILALCEKGGTFSLADLARELGTSIPKITRIVGEMEQAGILSDWGKQESAAGRRPSLYGLNPGAGVFVGVEVGQKEIALAVTDFTGRIIQFQDGIPYALTGTEESVLGLCACVKKQLRKYHPDPVPVRAVGVNLTGRVNHRTGYSYSYYISEEKPIRNILEEGFGGPVFIENDSRGMTFGEYMSGIAGDARTVLFLNVGWGLGMGMVLDGKLFSGKSGFSGEIGHFPLLDNHQICRCGKVGCLETGASGQALHRLIGEQLAKGHPSILSAAYAGGREITLNDILDAVEKEDVTAIECVEQVGSTLGRAVAGLINLFNPDVVVIGGRLCVTEQYLMPPLLGAVSRLSLNLVSNDTVIKVSRLGNKAGAVGASLLAKHRLLNR